MRACFMGQNISALGNGSAILQTPPLPPEPVNDASAPYPVTPAPKEPRDTQKDSETPDV